jgi:hypothetical protein
MASKRVPLLIGIMLLSAFSPHIVSGLGVYTQNAYASHSGKRLGALVPRLSGRCRPNLNVGRVHISPTISALGGHCGSFQTIRPAIPTGKELTYQGGNVIRTLHPHVIFWLPSGKCPADNPPNALPPGPCHFESGASATSLGDANYEHSIVNFFRDAGGTAFYAILSQYYGHAHLAPLNAITFNPTTDVSVDTRTALPHTGSASDPLYDSDLLREITRVIGAQRWLASGIDNSYFLFTPAHVQSCFDFTSCSGGTLPRGAGDTAQNYCAYHGSFVPAGGSSEVTYSNMYDGGTDVSCMYADPSTARYPYANEPTSCSGTSADGANLDCAAADAEISTTSHEMAETVTDPLTDAWYDNTSDIYNGWEIGDLCAYVEPSPAPLAAGADITLMNGHSYAIQEEYSNAAGSCVINAPAPEAAYTHLAVNVSHGWTRISWKSTRKVAGFNVYFKGKRLNKHLVTSRTLNYHFKVHAIAPHPTLLPVL